MARAVPIGLICRVCTNAVPNVLGLEGDSCCTPSDALARAVRGTFPAGEAAAARLVRQMRGEPGLQCDVCGSGSYTVAKDGAILKCGPCWSPRPLPPVYRRPLWLRALRWLAKL